MSTCQDIEKLAAAVCADVMKDSTNLAQRLDALKTLMPMYTILTKVKGKEPATDAEFSFGKFREDLEDGMEARNRARRGHSDS